MKVTPRVANARRGMNPNYNDLRSEAIFPVEMAMNESLDAAYAHLPPHIRQVAVKMAQQIALTAEPVKTTLEATFTEFLGQILLHVREWK